MDCLKNFFNSHPKLAVAFSGGVDSSYLLYACSKFKIDAKPYYVRTEFQPAFEFEDALRVCDELNFTLTVVERNILNDDEITANGQNRCYRCKLKILDSIIERARADGYEIIADGNNASDDPSGRPGMKAVEELGVVSPLRECGLTKEKIRGLSKEAGLSTWDKPAYSCLATRVAPGRKITREDLSKIEAAERLLFERGFTDFRARVATDGSARLQLPENQIGKIISERHTLLGELYKLYETVALDLKGR